MSSSLRRAFGTRVRALRHDRGWTQEELAQKSSLSVEAVGRIERGAFSPTLETIHKLATGLGVAIHDLFQSAQARHPERVEEIRGFVSRLENREVRSVWEALLSLFDPSRRMGVGG
jgi:transcriptional regulator with XRE-family HTH domain